MEKDMIISITGSQQFNNAQEEQVELVTAGKYEPIDGGWKISYQESEATGMGNTLTTFDVSPDSIILTRSGSVNSRIIFQKGKRHLSVYNTEFGSMTVGVGVSKMVNKLGERGGLLEVKYSIDIDQMVSGSNTFKINVKEPGRSRIKS